MCSEVLFSWQKDGDAMMTKADFGVAVDVGGWLRLAFAGGKATCFQRLPNLALADSLLLR
jgi:hypothetical protein